jgi:dTDP-4-amino-4,6-dideoxygalactose transaminase
VIVKAADLAAEFSMHKSEYRQAIDRVLESGHFILGDEVAAFEQEFARYTGANFGVGVNSGTDALIIALRACGIGASDEVLVPVFSFIATAEAVVAAGAVVRFVDVDPGTMNLSIDSVLTSSTERTRAVLPVHMFGMAADTDQLLQLAADRGWVVVEDCAHAAGLRRLGRHAGTVGQAGAFSFFPTKNLGAAGDAGLIITSDRHVADASRRLRAHGTTRKHWSVETAYNSRLDELQAALLRVRLRRLDAMNDARREIAALYFDYLADIPHVVPPPRGADHVFHQFSIRVPGRWRDDLLAWLRGNGIEETVYYPHTLAQMPAFSRWNTDQSAFPAATLLVQEVLSLPLRAQMREAEVGYVADYVGKFFAQART